MQAALNKDGFNVGRSDGKWGPKTRHAVQAFNQKKGIQGNNGQPTDQTLAALGVNPSQNQQQNENQQQPNDSGQ
jgi:peptidoglycan hydrolase-like protein with peptidoglycan-binding domain